MTNVMLVAPNDGATATFLERALAACNDIGQVTLFDYRSAAIRNGPGRMNQDLLEHGSMYDLVLILKGESIRPVTFQRLGARTRVAYWHLDPRDGHDKWVLERAQAATHFFTIAKGLQPWYAERGITAHWLSEACDPYTHRPAPVRPDDPAYPVSFVGTVADVPGREGWLLRVQQAFPGKVHVFGSLPGLLAGANHHGRAEDAAGLTGDLGLSLIVSQSLVNLGRDRNPELERSYGARLYRTLAAGGFLLTNRTAGMDEDFPSVATYGSDEECVDAIPYWLEHDEERRRVAAVNRKVVLERHTFQHRMTELLKVVGLA